ncbi:hypothetical protein [Aquimarina agarilytica]|uniref:hypothetical protein n=1 Tax=Aquimarina agarilytica TaxID=1087449 RepID=UPI000287AD97|nr:hypothetical protein [Aquimarina agarilytica]
MGQNNIIHRIVKLSKMLVSVNENYANVRKSSKVVYATKKFEKLQEEINLLRTELSKRFPWYCGLVLSNEEKEFKNEKIDIRGGENVLLQHYNSLLLICGQLEYIKNNLTASAEFKSIFFRLDTICHNQLNLLQKDFVSKKVKRKQLQDTSMLIA